MLHPARAEGLVNMGTPHSQNLRHYWILIIRLFGVISRILFFLTRLQRYSRHILQLQPAGFATFSSGFLHTDVPLLTDLLRLAYISSVWTRCRLKELTGVMADRDGWWVSERKIRGSVLLALFENDDHQYQEFLLSFDHISSVRAGKPTSLFAPCTKSDGWFDFW